MKLPEKTKFKLKRIIGKCIEMPPESVREDINFLNDTPIDSLGLVELFMTLEEKLLLDDIPADAIKKMVTVGDVFEYCQAHI